LEDKLDWRIIKCLQLRTLRDRDDRYSAATLAAGSTASTRAAQYLNSGILPNGSSAGLVRGLAAASTKANGMNTTPSGMASSWRAAGSTMPRRVETRVGSPGLMA